MCNKIFLFRNFFVKQLFCIVLFSYHALAAERMYQTTDTTPHAQTNVASSHSTAGGSIRAGFRNRYSSSLPKSIITINVDDAVRSVSTDMDYKIIKTQIYEQAIAMVDAFVQRLESDAIHLHIDTVPMQFGVETRDQSMTIELNLYLNECVHELYDTFQSVVFDKHGHYVGIAPCACLALNGFENPGMQRLAIARAVGHFLQKVLPHEYKSVLKIYADRGSHGFAMVHKELERNKTHLWNKKKWAGLEEKIRINPVTTELVALKNHCYKGEWEQALEIVQAYKTRCHEWFKAKKTLNNDDYAVIDARNSDILHFTMWQKKPSVPKVNQNAPSLASQQSLDTVVCKLDQASIAYAQENTPHLQYPIKSFPHELAVKRYEALEFFKQGSAGATNVYAKKYPISGEVKHYLQAHAIDARTLETCNGNVVQHTIHNEFIVLTDQTAHLWNSCGNSREIRKLTGVIGDFIDAGVSFNQVGEVTKALTLADAGWALLDCVQAAGEGAFEGVASVVHDIMHPIETVTNIAQAVATCSHYLSQAAVEVDCFVGDILVAGDYDRAYDRYETWCDTFKTIATVFGEHSKDLRARDVVKGVTTFAVQSYAGSKAASGLSKFFKQAHKNAVRIAQKISEGLLEESSVVMTAEGIPVRIAKEIAQNMSSAQKSGGGAKEVLTAANMNEFFKLPFGKILKQNSEITHYYYNKIKIYKLTRDIPGTTLEKGFHFYLDMKHKDHIEVFTAHGHPRGVFNLDGIRNAIKSDRAGGRRITL